MALKTYRIAVSKSGYVYVAAENESAATELAANADFDDLFWRSPWDINSAEEDDTISLQECDCVQED